MSERYDVVVVGAGLGGLSAATALSKRGLNVALVERQSIPGGYATSFTRGRFEFEVALHELSGVGSNAEPGPVFDYLKSLGVLDRITLLPIPDLYRSVFPCHDLRLPSGWDAYQEVLTRAFPDQADGIRRFLELVRQLDLETRGLESEFSQGKLSLSTLAQVPFRNQNVLRYQGCTWRSVLSRYVTDPQAQAVLSQYWGYVGMSPSTASFFFFALMLAAYVKSGAVYVRGRSQALSNAFVQALEAHGGKVYFHTPCARILTRNGRISGIETASGEYLEAPIVISNADPIHTTGMLPPSEIPSWWTQRLQASTPGASSVNLYLGLSQAPGELGIRDYETFVNSDYDQDSHFEAMRTLEAPKVVCVTTYNLCEPSFSPPGTSVVVVTGLVYGAPWFRLDPSAYVATKRRFADGMLTMAERVVPGIRGAIEVMEVSTPVTNHRYTGNFEGAIYGFEQPPWDATLWRLGHSGPVPGLFLVGAYTQPGGGFQPCMSSGQMVCEEVLQALAHMGRGGSHG